MHKKPRFSSPDKVVELVERRGGLPNQANQQALDFNWKCICATADALIQKKVLSAKEAIAIIQGTIQNIVGYVPLIRTSATSA